MWLTKISLFFACFDACGGRLTPLLPEKAGRPGEAGRIGRRPEGKKGPEHLLRTLGRKDPGSGSQLSIWRPKKAAMVWASLYSASPAAVGLSLMNSTSPSRSPSERIGAATMAIRRSLLSDTGIWGP